MPNSKSNPGKGDPPVDDPNALPADPPVVDPEKFVSKDDFDKQTQKLDQALLRIEQFGTAQAAQPVAPAAPTVDPSVEERSTKIADIDKKLKPLYDNYDDAVYKGKGVGTMLQQITNLEREKTVLVNQAAVDSAVGQVTQFGTNALGQISTEITAGKMSRLQIPEVKQAYDTMLSGMTPTDKANPQTLLGVYNYAVGQNIDKVIEIEQEAMIRKAAEDAANPQDPGTSSGGRDAGPGAGGGKEIKPEDVLSAENLAAITGKGRTVDEYYRSLDPSCNGFEEYYKKNHMHFDVDLLPPEGGS